MTTKIRFGFRSNEQVWLFAIWREYSIDGEVVYARVLFKI